VQAGSGSPFWLTQPVVLVRGAGAHGAAAVVAGAEVEAGAQLLSTSTAIAAMAQHSLMEVIGVTSGRPPAVNRPEGSTAVFLTFDGIREEHVRDRHTRIRIALQGPQAARLWRLLGEQLTDNEKATG
jgi:hypothetical protein